MHFINENVWFPIKISLKFVPWGLINNIPALVQIMAWRRPGDKPLSEPMMVRLSTHICVARPQWVENYLFKISFELLNIRALRLSISSVSKMQNFENMAICQVKIRTCWNSVPRMNCLPHNPWSSAMVVMWFVSNNLEKKENIWQGMQNKSALCNHIMCKNEWQFTVD